MWLETTVNVVEVVGSWVSLRCLGSDWKRLDMEVRGEARWEAR